MLAFNAAHLIMSTSRARLGYYSVPIQHVEELRLIELGVKSYSNRMTMLVNPERLKHFGRKLHISTFDRLCFRK